MGRTKSALGHLGEPLKQSVEDMRAVKLQRMSTSPLSHLSLVITGHGDRQIQRVGDRVRTANRNDHGSVADRLADPTSVGGDHWTTASQHLLHQGDAEGLDELRSRLARQHKGRAASHQVRFLVITDIVKKAGPIRYGSRCGELAEVLCLGSITGDH